ncbi:glycosyltransferase 87 family protein [Mariniluteicoccus endophyticus]
MLWLLVPLAASLFGASNWGAHNWWNPPMEDLMVYRRAASALLAGRDPYELVNSFPFIYPPFAAILSLVLAPMSESFMKIAWAWVNVVALSMVLRRLGLDGWRLAVVCAAILSTLAPFTYTLALGQLGIVLMAMCLLDALDGDPRAATWARSRPRWLPTGVLVGLAAGIKLTPAVFLILFWLVGRRRDAVVGVLTFLTTVAIGFIGLFGPALGYWTRLTQGDSGANPDAFGWLFNQSILSGWQRFYTVDRSAGGLVISVVVVLVALVAALRCVRHGNPWLAVGVLGLASSLANPIAWVHHMTWIVPLAIGAWQGGAPAVVRGLAFLSAAWWHWEPFARLPGAPWAQAEQYAYSVNDKLLAAGGAIVCGLMVLLAAVWPWRTPAAPGPRPVGELASPAEVPLVVDERDSDHA